MTSLTTELLVLCDQAIISREGKLSIIGIFNQIFVHNLPTRFLRMYIVAVFSGAPESSHALTLQIKDSTSKIIEKRQFNLKLGVNGKANLIHAIQGLPIKSVGTFKISFKKGNKNLTSRDLQVVKIKHKHPSTNLPN